MADGDVTAQGEALIKDWMVAGQQLDRATSEVTRAQCAVSNAVTALGKWMVPGDVKDGEKISVWYGDSLVQVEVINSLNNTYRITTRQRGRSLRR